jgi:hypothetical protein
VKLARAEANASSAGWWMKSAHCRSVGLVCSRASSDPAVPSITRFPHSAASSNKIMCVARLRHYRLWLQKR